MEIAGQATDGVLLGHAMVGHEVFFHPRLGHLPPFPKQIGIEVLFQPHRNGFSVDTQVIQLVEHHKAAIQQRVLGQHILPNVGALGGHAGNKVFPALFQIHHLVKVPGINLLPTAHHPAVRAAGLQGAHIVGNAEGKHTHNALCHRQAAFISLGQKRQIALGIGQNLLQLHLMKLMGNHPIVLAGGFAQKVPPLQPGIDLLGGLVGVLPPLHLA